ncbi:ANTAR domain-containing protein [Amycolatopsis carbonis]|uniref:ANTAR domain-containing protein n=1 Tax=Amycolatopsis carbonis TaxID=715471 RepID=A0A9Y2INZ3_9PSEU|nr:ANTAR domain-containing protein [Amycolatopsis sp. 2-15]WIX82849.1 ANTAR domain-containing protein [Amycolatopsis sp. 2-15]
MSTVESQPWRTSRSTPTPRHAPEGTDALAVLAEENRQLRQALQSRGVIEQAKGVLMAQRCCGADEAFAVLVKLSQDTNVKLCDVARAFLDEFLTTAPRARQEAPRPRLDRGATYGHPASGSSPSPSPASVRALPSS